MFGGRIMNIELVGPWQVLNDVKMTMQTYFNFSKGTHVTIVQEGKCFQNEFFIHDNVP